MCARVSVGMLLLFGVMFLLAKFTQRISEWIERKTGNSTLAFFGPAAVLMALNVATTITLIKALAPKP